MSKHEFLARLKEALENDLDSRAVQENVAYYNSYITNEMDSGRGEDEVLEELGDPWVIAQSVINMAELQKESAEEASDRQTARNVGSEYTAGRGNTVREFRTFSIDAWWKKLLLVLGIIGIVLIVVAVIGGVLSLVLPVIVPVLAVIFLIRLIKNLRR